MSEQVIFNQNFFLDVAADVSIDFSAAQGYFGFSGNEPWYVKLVVDGVDNSIRGGAGVATDVVQLMGACGQLAAGYHNIQVRWSATDRIEMSGAVLRVLICRR